MPKESPTSDERTLVGRIAAAALDRSVVVCRSPSSGAVADTFVLELDGGPGRAVCKLDGRNIWTGDVVEPLVVELVGERTNLPVPEVLATGTVRRGEETRRWALYEFLDGDVPGGLERETRRSVVNSAGAALGTLHDAFEYEYVGGFERDGDALELRTPRGRNLLASAPVCEVLSTVAAGDTECLPVLDHGDFFPGNLLVADGELAAVLDWGNAHVTHAGYGLARAEARFVDVLPIAWSERTRLRRAFRDGYTDHAPLPPSYRRRAPVYKALWLVQSCVNLAAVAGSERGRTQLRRQLRNWTARSVPPIFRRRDEG